MILFLLTVSFIGLLWSERDFIICFDCSIYITPRFKGNIGRLGILSLAQPYQVFTAKNMFIYLTTDAFYMI